MAAIPIFTAATSVPRCPSSSFLRFFLLFPDQFLSRPAILRLLRRPPSCTYIVAAAARKHNYAGFLFPRRFFYVQPRGCRYSCSCCCCCCPSFTTVAFSLSRYVRFIYENVNEFTFYPRFSKRTIRRTVTHICREHITHIYKIIKLPIT